MAGEEYVQRPYYSSSLISAMNRSRPNLGAAFTAGGNYATSLIQAIAQGMQQRRQDEIANQLLSQALNSGNYAPRAALVGQGNVSNADWQKLRQSNTSFVGTAPQVVQPGMGGVAGLQAYNAQQQANLQDAMNRAKLQNDLAKSQPGYMTPAERLAEQQIIRRIMKRI